MKRTSTFKSGYDCGPDGSTCEHETKGNHGIGGDKWIYAVDDGDVALVLTVYTTDYPESANFKHRPNEPRATGTWLHLHTSFPVERDSIRNGDHGAPCDVLESKRCFAPWYGCLEADEFFKEHGVETFEQMESFWLALETRCRELGAEFREKRVDTKYERCSHCDGTGTVRRSS